MCGGETTRLRQGAVSSDDALVLPVCARGFGVAPRRRVLRSLGRAQRCDGRDRRANNEDQHHPARYAQSKVETTHLPSPCNILGLVDVHRRAPRSRTGRRPQLSRLERKPPHRKHRQRRFRRRAQPLRSAVEPTFPELSKTICDPPALPRTDNTTKAGVLSTTLPQRSAATQDASPPSGRCDIIGRTRRRTQGPAARPTVKRVPRGSIARFRTPGALRPKERAMGDAGVRSGNLPSIARLLVLRRSQNHGLADGRHRQTCFPLANRHLRGQAGACPCRPKTRVHRSTSRAAVGPGRSSRVRASSRRRA